MSEELITFVFFNLNISVEMKNRMVCALEKPDKEHPLKQITLNQEDLQVKELDDFVSTNTRRFFNLTVLSTKFLTKGAKLLGKDEEYKSVDQW